MIVAADDDAAPTVTVLVDWGVVEGVLLVVTVAAEEDPTITVVVVLCWACVVVLQADIRRCSSRRIVCLNHLLCLSALL